MKKYILYELARHINGRLSAVLHACLNTDVTKCSTGTCIEAQRSDGELKPKESEGMI